MDKQLVLALALNLVGALGGVLSRRLPVAGKTALVLALAVPIGCLGAAMAFC